ncbi:flagellar biosynthesis anti-sigma factor FlgM [Thiomicrospira microaerophila]|uniref:flagellar biosynthesis anti-sigma factor FlgM n=1 Tax=Thiomicrospira microaerophila TaxID=406020 RepID=UPI00200C4D61|nr:flagellar biosynthesis anti-sigma factor FlgM [Thiomicrospira microaerophila]UQB42655.1 flagellar biosynthesis anti-sigma factor FlgM [Thiomicrospira microaerophila]
MDIKNLNNNLTSTRSHEPAKSSEKATPNNSINDGNKPSSDKVTLTSLSAQIREIEKRAASAQSSNEARIAELKRAIDDGSYKVDASRVADKLITTELLFARA